MEKIESVELWQSSRKTISKESLGFVPTMGALHKGHMALVERSLKENDKTVVSVFLNPTQFDKASDLEKYPKTLSEDIKLLESYGVDYLFLPNKSEIYSDDFRFKVMESDFSKTLCGSSREGHFTGVLTIMMKLLNIIQPQNAYFGEKDYQQLTLIQNMVNAFFMDVNIVACKTVREKDGLAFSSRNIRLSKEGRRLASVFPQYLNNSKNVEEVKEKLKDKVDKEAVDYVEDIFIGDSRRRFAAIYIDGVRLIDNVEI